MGKRQIDRAPNVGKKDQIETPRGNLEQRVPLGFPDLPVKENLPALEFPQESVFVSISEREGIDDDDIGPECGYDRPYDRPRDIPANLGL